MKVDQNEADDRLQTVNLPISASAASTPQNDSGEFALNFHDEKALPFDGSGQASKWRLQLPNEFAPSRAPYLQQKRAPRRELLEPLCRFGVSARMTECQRLTLIGRWLAHAIGWLHDAPSAPTKARPGLQCGWRRKSNACCPPLSDLHC